MRKSHAGIPECLSDRPKLASPSKVLQPVARLRTAKSAAGRNSKTVKTTKATTRCRALNRARMRSRMLPHRLRILLKKHEAGLAKIRSTCCKIRLSRPCLMPMRRSKAWKKATMSHLRSLPQQQQTSQQREDVEDHQKRM